MKAVVFTPAPGGASAGIAELPKPTPGKHEALVRVHAAGVNRGELSVRAGLKSGNPQQSGIEFAGVVIETDGEVTEVHAGDRVMGHWKGGQAEFVTVDSRLLVPIPKSVDWISAAAWLNVFTTAHDALVTNAVLKAGESVLVNAASSGIGIAAIQIAKLMGATPVIGSSRSAEKLKALAGHGLPVGVDASTPDWVDAVKKATGGKGVDIVIDSVGADVLKQNLDALALGGRIVSVGRLSATKGEVDLDQLSFKRASIIGVTFRTRSLEQRIACVRACACDLLPALADGRIAPIVDRTFPFTEIAAAHAYMERDAHIGKIVLTMS